MSTLRTLSASTSAAAATAISFKMQNPLPKSVCAWWVPPAVLHARPCRSARLGSQESACHRFFPTFDIMSCLELCLSALQAFSLRKVYSKCHLPATSERVRPIRALERTASPKPMRRSSAASRVPLWKRSKYAQSCTCKNKQLCKMQSRSDIARC